MKHSGLQATVYAALLLLAGLAGCATLSGKPTDWDRGAMKTAEELAGRLRAAGIPCDNFAPEPFGEYQSLHGGKFPIADAVATCDSAPADPDDAKAGDAEPESLMFEVFGDAKAARVFLEAKQSVICKQVAKNAKLSANFPGFPYVDGGTWLIEPDTGDTARRIAPLLGATAKQERCR